MLERRKPLDLLFPLKGNAASRTGDNDVRPPTTLDRLRAGVTLARDAVKAVSVTAMEALREGASFIGIVGETDELVDPFSHLDAPIWSEKPPAELHKLAYRYCEELTMREAGNFYHSFKYLPEETVVTAIKNRPVQQSVVVTGRGGGRLLRSAMDTISEVKDIEHAYRAGVQARKGVDF